MSAAPVQDLTADEIADFHRDGAVLIKQILPANWVDLAARWLDAAIAQPVPDVFLVVWEPV